jgi:uncharacterized protein YbcI
MTDPHGPPGDVATADGALKSAISNAMVALLREHTGRGPTKVRTILSEDVVLVVLEDLLTRAETRLVQHGQAAQVLGLRKSIQTTMRDDLVEVVQRLTGRKVIAFMSTNHADPDMAAELFMLEPLAH